MAKKTSKNRKKKVVVKLTRGDFIKLATAAVGSIIAAPLLTTGPLSPFGKLKQQQLEGGEVELGHIQTGEYHWGMVINLDTCIGCEYCTRACTATNDVKADDPWNVVYGGENNSRSYVLPQPPMPALPECPMRGGLPG